MFAGFRKTGAALAFAGTLLGSAAGAAAGYIADLFREPVYSVSIDPSRPKYRDVPVLIMRPETATATESYTFKPADTLWEKTKELYALQNAPDKDIAKKVKEVAIHNSSRIPRIMDDTKSVVNGKTVSAPDGIPGDDIKAGTTVEFPGVKKTAAGKIVSERVIEGYEMMPVKTEPESYMPLFVRLGAALGFLSPLFYRGFRKRKIYEIADEAESEAKIGLFKNYRTGAEAFLQEQPDAAKARGAKLSEKEISAVKDATSSQRNRFILEDYLFRKKSVADISKAYGLEAKDVGDILQQALMIRKGIKLQKAGIAPSVDEFHEFYKTSPGTKGVYSMYKPLENNGAGKLETAGKTAE